MLRMVGATTCSCTSAMVYPWRRGGGSYKRCRPSYGTGSPPRPSSWSCLAGTLVLEEKLMILKDVSIRSLQAPGGQNRRLDGDAALPRWTKTLRPPKVFTSLSMAERNTPKVPTPSESSGSAGLGQNQNTAAHHWEVEKERDVPISILRLWSWSDFMSWSQEVTQRFIRLISLISITILRSIKVSFSLIFLDNSKK